MGRSGTSKNRFGEALRVQRPLFGRVILVLVLYGIHRKVNLITTDGAKLHRDARMRE